QFYAHGVPTGLADFFHAGAHHLAFIGDQHDLVRLPYRERADDVAGFFSSLHCDNAFAAARLPPIIIERRAFADPIFASYEQHSVWIDDRDGHDMIAFLRTNSPDAHGVAPLIAQLFFVEAQAHSIFRDKNDLVVAVR